MAPTPRAASIQMTSSGTPTPIPIRQTLIPMSTEATTLKEAMRQIKRGSLERTTPTHQSTTSIKRTTSTNPRMKLRTIAIIASSSSTWSRHSFTGIYFIFSIYRLLLSSRWSDSLSKILWIYRKRLCPDDPGYLSLHPQGFLRLDVESASRARWEEACRHQVGQHSRDILEGLSPRPREGDRREDPGQDEPHNASGKWRVLLPHLILPKLLEIRG